MTKGKAKLTLLTLLASATVAESALAFENAKVLPKGVRNLNLRRVDTDIENKTDSAGVARPLAEPLAQELTFKKIAAGEEALKANQLRAFLTSNGFDESQAVGEFTADLNGHLTVMAPIFSIGVSEKLTLAIAAPIYDAKTSIDVGFTPNETAGSFLAALSNPENNQSAAARDAGLKLNQAVERLNTKLLDNRFAALEDWHQQGIGDVTLAAKYRAYGGDVLGIATTTGLVAPTGRTDDQDILNDIAFGDGQWDVFGQLAADQEVGAGFVLNQFAKYTVQLPDDKNVRAVTEDEKIEVEYTEARFKLGDKVDAGASVQWQSYYGPLAGVGYTAFRKMGDTYRELDPETKKVLEAGSDQTAQNAEAQLGYSTIPLYQRGAFAVPFEVKASYVRQMSSTNMPVTDLAQVDLSLFF